MAALPASSTSSTEGRFAVPPKGRHTTSHEVDIKAPAERVYRIVADAADWPQRFVPTIHVEHTGLGAGAERLEIWATGNGEVKHWTSRRELDPAARRVEFRQEVSSPPVASMGGTWIVSQEPNGVTRLVLEHDFEAVDDDPEGVAWITRATDRNSATELGNIKALAEGWDRLAELTFSFEDSVVVNGAPEEVYDFLYRADLWPERLPHVASMKFAEEEPGVQEMAMETRTKDGSTHTTESVRVCFPHERIVYKQLVPPSLMTAHLGEWTFTAEGEGRVRATSRHTVTVKEDAITTVLGEGATVQTAKEFIRKAAGGNSTATLNLAKEFVEARRGEARHG
ncbi:cyclase [Actinomadura sp. LD22]|uniref:Cyclase n=1 Tax=Actinomadura physcomitrii TaxID=2650748 RepID=A0A6I4MIZ9_9ACTN|nr:cyclase [Actinomadura physcomitrii]